MLHLAVGLQAVSWACREWISSLPR